MKFKKEIRLMVVPYANARMTVRASLVFEKVGMPNARSKKPSVDHIKEKYFTKITPDDLQAEKKRLFEARRIMSACTSPLPATPKTPLRISQLKLDHIREFQHTKQARNRAMSAFFAQKNDVRNSIQKLAVGICRNLELKSNFSASWGEVIRLLGFFARLQPVLKQLQDQRVEYPEQVKTLLLFFTKLKTDVPLSFKRFTGGTGHQFQLLCTIKSNGTVQASRDRARGIIRQFLETLSRHTTLESKMQYHGANCFFIRQNFPKFDSEIHPALPGFPSRIEISSGRRIRNSYGTSQGGNQDRALPNLLRLQTDQRSGAGNFPTAPATPPPLPSEVRPERPEPHPPADALPDAFCRRGTQAH